MGKQQPNVFLQVKKLKEKVELVSWQLKSKESGGPDQRRRKTYVKQNGRTKKNVEEYDISNDLYKCLKALSCKNKCE